MLSHVAAFADEPGMQHTRSAAAAAYPYAEDSPAFWEWFLCDYAAAGHAGSVLASYADAATDMSVEEQVALQAALFTPVRPYQAIEAVPSSGLVVKDLLSGAELRLGSFVVPENTIQSDVIVSRAVPVGRFRRSLICWLAFPPSVQTDLMAYLRGAYRLLQAGRHVAIDDFADMHVDLYHAFLAQPGRDGRVMASARLEPWAPAQVTYTCTAHARAAAALDREATVERQSDTPEGGRRYAWRGGPAGSAGTILLTYDAVSADANTHADLLQIRQLLEDALKGFIAFREEHATECAVPRASSGRPAGRAFLERMLASWPDRESPELSDQTPRAACATKRGQDSVIHLLLDLERDLARQKRIGRAWVDPSDLWETLGLARPTSHRNPPSAPTAPAPRPRRPRMPRRGRPRT